MTSPVDLKCHRRNAYTWTRNAVENVHFNLVNQPIFMKLKEGGEVVIGYFVSLHQTIHSDEA